MQIIWQQGFSYMRVDIWRHGSLITLLYWLRCQRKNKHRSLWSQEQFVTCVLNYAFDGVCVSVVLSCWKDAKYIRSKFWNYVFFRTRIDIHFYSFGLNYDTQPHISAAVVQSVTCLSCELDNRWTVSTFPAGPEDSSIHQNLQPPLGPT